MRAFLSLFLPLLISSLHAEKIITNPNWVARNTPVVTVDSILLRDTVSRMYITLKQLPHTSLTIHDDWVVQDSIKRFSGKVRDIDGVDFDRIFQFDSDSTIHIEMDFPAPSVLNGGRYHRKSKIQRNQNYRFISNRKKEQDFHISTTQPYIQICYTSNNIRHSYTTR